MRLPSFAGVTRPSRYALIAPVLLLVPHAAVALLLRARGTPLLADAGFWLLPMRRLAMSPDLPAGDAAIAFAVALIAAGALALLSFRRANWSGAGYALAAVVVVPAAQIAVAAILAVLPRFEQRDGPGSAFAPGSDTAHVVQGVLAGVAIIVAAVLVSALTFGSYGWSLFVATPFLVGVTTGYLANRRLLLSGRATARLVLIAAALGTAALVALALEGFVCILLAAPLGAVAALIGGAAGRAVARMGQGGGKPLASVALLPALFALEAATPPDLPITAWASVEVTASPGAVWSALTGDQSIESGPGVLGAAGLAYPLRGRLLGHGVGAVRLGEFSTGVARERVTEWVPRRRLGFEVLKQAPAMEEMSPYRRVHAPHVQGYFETGRTSFTLFPLPGGRTRLDIEAHHVLRVEPVLYWEPLARLAIRMNLSRVLDDLKGKAEAGGRTARLSNARVS
ncbi:SRPBCC family protein [uncultured Sphingomonas sp.]|uniref:SRPBCC family protein n=1 Tax=uncultured Sphingomonas sp. TaxID=158754 RepID=UPI002588F1A9|nr:SRPBCC family protein [uncultured Sphingomonas sp.]